MTNLHTILTDWNSFQFKRLNSLNYVRILIKIEEKKQRQK